MLFQCWSIVFDAGPTLKQHWMIPRVFWAVFTIQIYRAVGYSRWTSRPITCLGSGSIIAMSLCRSKVLGNKTAHVGKHLINWINHVNITQFYHHVKHYHDYEEELYFRGFAIMSCTIKYHDHENIIVLQYEKQYVMPIKTYVFFVELPSCLCYLDYENICLFCCNMENNISCL